jgi:hypothetical protein
MLSKWGFDQVWLPFGKSVEFVIVKNKNKKSTKIDWFDQGKAFVTKLVPHKFLISAQCWF